MGEGLELILLLNGERITKRNTQRMNAVEDCIYHKFSGSKHIFLVLYVDDILIASYDIGLLHEIKRFLSNKFEMKNLGEASFVLGIEIHRDRSRGILGLSQRNYIERILKRFGMQDYKPGDIPMAKGDKLSLDQCPKNDFQRTKHCMLTYRRSSHIEIIGYSDSDYDGCQDSSRSTSGYVYLLAGCAISWKSSKHELIATSTMEA
ncbi:uncharacterized mitochondrial protein AtMg00810-like [Spinacia oleracea]|uniref:Uncharacterized mitochondrial protein AtMg00810-like n=1 Tax=Spinacia oleracea TaxID=3562 RepID=A0A9R0I0Y3_SPIOL|nr:uncharacterized mitochondrial protein AtMg00810-like [Spinacia oleracea]